MPQVQRDEPWRVGAAQPFVARNDVVKLELQRDDWKRNRQKKTRPKTETAGPSPLPPSQKSTEQKSNKTTLTLGERRQVAGYFAMRTKMAGVSADMVADMLGLSVVAVTAYWNELLSTE
ncbi:hypothetical protein K2Q16_03650 [Patescibacteria group bacterium]|nr:hypothetical protein [Patescibacteria group bacterium]